LNLFQFAASTVAKASTRPSKVMRCEGKGTRVTSETPAKLKNQRGVRPARIEDIDGEFDLLVGETDE